MGEMLSITSAGTPLMPLGKAVAESPSPPLRAHAATGEERVREGFAVLALAGDLGVPQAVGALGQYFLGYGLCQGAMDHAGQDVADDVPGPTGAG
jgi:hypothetical protein